ncbi:MAG: hypothetical protein K6C05_09025 [Anaerovibrio sp.]|uniref:hypothetical protein n=1 Tax=Anaerovibrio sp. TaxID=1872532 RepID=UPI0025F38931|nr:hypothetical protein [Anaerovibrio sp.]MCR5176974.1 hypothetical protein [Anaerovibrio sp.]
MKLIKTAIALCVFFVSTSAVALAHWMPESEMYIGGVGHGCTLEYVKSIFGEPQEKKWFNSDGCRGVRYIYNQSYSVTARVKDDDPTPENKLQVTNVNLKGSNLDTPSGLTVGIPYQTVAGMFGMGEKKQYTDRMFYYYKLENTNRSMTFYVNNFGIITEIIYAEEW